MEGKLRLKINWASLTVEGKFTVFALFYFVFEGNIPSTSPRGAYIWRGDLTEGFLRYRFGGLIFGGAKTWRGLFSEFYGMRYKADTTPPRSRKQNISLCFLISISAVILKLMLKITSIPPRDRSWGVLKKKKKKKEK